MLLWKGCNVIESKSVGDFIELIGRVYDLYPYQKELINKISYKVIPDQEQETYEVNVQSLINQLGFNYDTVTFDEVCEELNKQIFPDGYIVHKTIKQ